jgi:hypothetical protein
VIAHLDSGEDRRDGSKLHVLVRRYASGPGQQRRVTQREGLGVVKFSGRTKLFTWLLVNNSGTVEDKAVIEQFVFPTPIDAVQHHFTALTVYEGSTDCSNKTSLLLWSHNAWRCNHRKHRPIQSETLQYRTLWSISHTSEQQSDLSVNETKRIVADTRMYAQEKSVVHTLFTDGRVSFVLNVTMPS